MILIRKDIEKILDILDKFPEVNGFELHQEGSSGIGKITTMSFAHEHNGVKGCLEVEISGVESW
jgi:hypothetical protein